MAHIGIVFFSPFLGSNQQGRKIVLGKVVESPPGSGVYIDKEAKWGWAKDDGGVLRRWARAAPDPGLASTTIASLPSDADPFFRATLPTSSWSGFDYTLTIVVIRNATGIAKSWTVSGTELSWASDGGGEAYNVTLTVTLTKDQATPAEFDTYQLSSNAVTGTTQTYTDPRSPI